MAPAPEASVPGDASPPGSLPRLGYLLKHANLRFGELVQGALEPLGIGPREWAALLCLNDQRARSQAEVAHQLGIDRTSMVALIDDLEERALVERRTHRDDRRKKDRKSVV